MISLSPESAYTSAMAANSTYEAPVGRSTQPEYKYTNMASTADGENLQKGCNYGKPDMPPLKWNLWKSTPGSGYMICYIRVFIDKIIVEWKKQCYDQYTVISIGNMYVRQQETAI